MGKLVLVETVSEHRIRYVVDVGDAGDEEWAKDTVICDEATEVSQEHIGELIVSHRVIDEAEYVRLFDEGNQYQKNWDIDAKKAYITVLADDEPALSGGGDV